MLQEPFVYSNETHPDSSRVVIVLPEVFGLTKGIRDAVDYFANNEKVLSFGLDFYYEIDGKTHDHDYRTEGGEAMDLMKQTTGKSFLKIFDHALNVIINEYPQVQEIIVCGFCFGGRLAWLSAVNPSVTKIISFYGSRANEPFHLGKTVIECLAKVRANDSTLKTLAFFGKHDDTIPLKDRELIQKQLSMAGIYYSGKVYEAGHAFFNHERPSYNEAAAIQAKSDIKEFLSD